MALISKETATDIAFAYREIETAEKLLAEITDTLGRPQSIDIRDAFGRRQDGLQLGVPTGNSSRQLFNVPWRLARPIIEAHIAEKRACLAALTMKAQSEMVAADPAA